MESLNLKGPVNTVCRTCLKTHRKFVNIFEHIEDDRSVSEMLGDCTSIKVKIGDGLPKNICSTCLKKLNSACSFKTMVTNSDRVLHQCAESRDTEDTKVLSLQTRTLCIEDDIKVEPSNCMINYNEIKQDDTDDVESDSCIDEEKIENANVHDIDPVSLNNGKNLVELFNSMSDCENEKPNLTLSPTNEDIGDIDFGDNSNEEAPLKKPNRKRKKPDRNRREKDQNTVLCKYCNKIFSFRYYIDIHVHQHTGNTPYKCDECDRRFVKRSVLNKHKQLHSDTKPYQCNVCGKRFKYLGNVNNHKVIHSEQKPYKCDICNKGFKVPGGLKIHKRRHTGERPYICEICGKSFISKGDLALHIGTHNTTKNFTCSKCGKTFANKISLKVHIKRHSNNKPYACDRCSKSFSTNAILQHHILIHTGEKPYSCNICGKTFRQLACIPRHMRIHTGETPYPCEQCPSKFKYKHHLLNHMKTHS